MLDDVWPLQALQVTTPRLVLRMPALDELVALGVLAADGVHDPAVMPFGVPWTDQAPGEVTRSVVQYHWRQLSAIAAQDWTLPFVVFHDGAVIGTQDIRGKDFPVTREVSTGSWLGQRHQGHGFGTEMRAAVLHLAFAGLGAQAAISGAFAHNQRSLGVSRRLGYRPDGTDRKAVRGELAIHQRLRLTREDWDTHRTVETGITGLPGCLRLLGVNGGEPGT